MSAALAAAIVRNRPAIGTRHTYIVTVNTKTGEQATEPVTVVAHEPDCVVVEGTKGCVWQYRAEWPGDWQDGTMKEEA